MLLRAFVIFLAVSVSAPPTRAAADLAATAVAATVAGSDTSVPPPVTLNEFLPEDRSLGDCLSSLPKPGCGSEARGGWRQGLVLGAILVGLGFIAWRVVAGARKARA
ncbi:MAG TPA: hypothetical protein VIS05_12125 [Ilumatobacter sp.]